MELKSVIKIYSFIVLLLYDILSHDFYIHKFFICINILIIDKMYLLELIPVN